MNDSAESLVSCADDFRLRLGHGLVGLSLSLSLSLSAVGDLMRYLDGFVYAISRAVCSSNMTVVSRCMATTISREGPGCDVVPLREVSF